MTNTREERVALPACPFCGVAVERFDGDTVWHPENDCLLSGDHIDEACWSRRVEPSPDVWEGIETHGGHCSPVLVCRETPTETIRAVSAFLDVTGVWRMTSTEGGMTELRFEPTHWRPLPDPPKVTVEEDRT